MDQQRVALIIGGANGIGAACSRLMSDRGWSVVIGDKDEEASRQLAAEIGGHGFAVDVSDRVAMEQLGSRIESEVGPVSSLVVSAATFQENTPIESMSYDDWERIKSVNLDGTYYANRIFGIRMAARRQGSIVNIASFAGLGSSPLHMYGASKAAVICLTQSLAGEWGRAGVRVNSVSPGVTLVPRVIARIERQKGKVGDPSAHMALGRCVETKEVAEGVEFLASARASAITGINMVIDAGWMVATNWERYGGVRKRPQA